MSLAFYAQRSPRRVHDWRFFVPARPTFYAQKINRDLKRTYYLKGLLYEVAREIPISPAVVRHDWVHTVLDKFQEVGLQHSIGDCL
jgi:hypothetical protein